MGQQWVYNVRNVFNQELVDVVTEKVVSVGSQIRIERSGLKAGPLPDTRSVNRIYIDGVESACAVGDVTITAASNTAVVSDAIIVTLGDAVALAAASVSVSGSFATGNIGDVSIFENARPTFDGVSATGEIGIPTITVTVFDYDAVASLYARTRTVFVERKTSAKDRTIVVAAQSRIVYVEHTSTPYTRTVDVSKEDRKVYTYRKSSSSDRAVLVS